MPHTSHDEMISVSYSFAKLETFWLKLSMLGVCLRLNSDLCIYLFLKFQLKLFCWEKYIVLPILNSEEPSFEKLYQFHALK